jgi:hypothetical protein
MGDPASHNTPSSLHNRGVVTDPREKAERNLNIPLSSPIANRAGRTLMMHGLYLLPSCRRGQYVHMGPHPPETLIFKLVLTIAHMSMIT